MIFLTLIPWCCCCKNYILDKCIMGGCTLKLKFILYYVLSYVCQGPTRILFQSLKPTACSQNPVHPQKPVKYETSAFWCNFLIIIYIYNNITKPGSADNNLTSLCELEKGVAHLLPSCQHPLDPYRDQHKFDLYPLPISSSFKRSTSCWRPPSPSLVNHV